MNLQTRSSEETGFAGAPGMRYRRQTRPRKARVARRKDASRVAEMAMSDFATAGLVVRVRSALFGEEVIFASDNAEIAPDLGLPVYRARELSRLLASTDDLRQLHATKREGLGQ